jgi:hypothetical protein
MPRQRRQRLRRHLQRLPIDRHRTEHLHRTLPTFRRPPTIHRPASPTPNQLQQFVSSYVRQSHRHLQKSVNRSNAASHKRRIPQTRSNSPKIKAVITPSSTPKQSLFLRSSTSFLSHIRSCIFPLSSPTFSP